MNVEHDVLMPQRFGRDGQKIAPFNYRALARLKPGVSVADANAELARLFPMFLASWPENGPGFGKMLENAKTCCGC
jgi:putative ABC transport system permease protein